MSLGGDSGTKAQEDALQYAEDNDVMVVCAAGNAGEPDSVKYPAKYENAYAVSSTDRNDDLSGFSSRGPEVDIAAPGSAIPSTVPDDGYSQLSGTSMACPHVAGAAGTFMAVNEDRERLWDELGNTAEDIGLRDNYQGNGLLDVETLATRVAEGLAVNTSSVDRGDTFATLNGQVIGLENGSTDAWFEYRQAGASRWETTSTVSVDDFDPYSVDIDGLAVETTYEFRAVVDDGSNSDTGKVVTFTTAPEELTVETRGVTGIEWDTDLDTGVATLQGTLLSPGPGGSAEAAFEYREAGGSWQTTPKPSIDGFDTDYEVQITGVESQTTYEFRAVGETGSDSATGRTESFESGRMPTPPVVDYDLTDTSDRFQSSVAIDWSVEMSPEAQMGELDSVRSGLENALEWDSQTSDLSGESGSGRHELEGLGSGEFLVTLEATDTVGDTNRIERSVLLDGTPIDDPADVAVSTGQASDVSEREATLEGRVTSLDGTDQTDAWFEYRQAGESRWETTSKRTVGTEGFEATVSGLAGGTDYEFRAVAETDAASDEGGVAEFTTAGGDDPDPEPDVDVGTGSATDVGETEATMTGQVKLQNGASESDAWFEYRQAGDSSWETTAQETVGGGAYESTVTDLDTGTDYEFRAVAALDSASDTGQVADFSTDGGGDPDPDPGTLEITRFDVSKDEGFGFADAVVYWSAAAGAAPLDTVTLATRSKSLGDRYIRWDETVVDVDGDSASDTDELRLSSGREMEVSIKVEDADGNAVEDTSSV